MIRIKNREYSFLETNKPITSTKPTCCYCKRTDDIHDLALTPLICIHCYWKVCKFNYSDIIEKRKKIDQRKKNHEYNCTITGKVIVPDEVCFSCGELYDRRGHCWNEHYICSKCVVSNDCQCMDCMIDQPYVRNVILSIYASLKRWKGTQQLRSIVKTNESPNGVKRILSLMKNLPVQDRKKGCIKLNNTTCPLYRLLTVDKGPISISAMQYLSELLNQVESTSFCIFGPKVEIKHYPQVLRNKHPKSRLGPFFFKYIIVIVETEFLDQNWLLIVYDNLRKKIHHLCDDTSVNAMDKIGDFENYLKCEWINCRRSNNTYIRKVDGKKVITSSIFDKELVLKRVDLRKVYKSDLYTKANNKKYVCNSGVLCFWTAILFLEKNNDIANKTYDVVSKLMNKGNIHLLRQITIVIMISNDIEYFNENI